jgi:hypothetical protein
MICRFALFEGNYRAMRIARSQRNLSPQADRYAIHPIHFELLSLSLIN